MRPSTRFIRARRPDGRVAAAEAANRPTTVVPERPARRAGTYEPSECPIHVLVAEMLTSSGTGNVSVKLTALNLETGEPIELTPLLISSGKENLACDGGAAGPRAPEEAQAAGAPCPSCGHVHDGPCPRPLRRSHA